MKTNKMFRAALIAGCVFFVGCQSGGNKARTTGDRQGGPRQDERASTPVYTASHNPTTLAGRGQPSLDDQFRPAAWILVDDQEGRYPEVDGHPHLEWVIGGSVSTSPTFRVEVFPPLLGQPDGFKAVLQSMHTRDGSSLFYGLTADAGSFTPGTTYNLLNPGPNFTIRNLITGDVVQEMGELPPGKYAFAGGIRNAQTGAETPAVTFFTVGD